VKGYGVIETGWTFAADAATIEIAGKSSNWRLYCAMRPTSWIGEKSSGAQSGLHRLVGRYIFTAPARASSGADCAAAHALTGSRSRRT
jgi:hypothetical protein